MAVIGLQLNLDRQQSGIAVSISTTLVISIYAPQNMPAIHFLDILNPFMIHLLFHLQLIFPFLDSLKRSRHYITIRCLFLWLYHM